METFEIISWVKILLSLPSICIIIIFNLNGVLNFEYRQPDFRVPVETSLHVVYLRYTAMIMKFSLHYNIKYFKINNCFPSIFFQLMCLFRHCKEEFQFQCSFNSRKYRLCVTANNKEHRNERDSLL